MLEGVRKNYTTLKDINNRWRDLKINDSNKKDPPRVRSSEYKKLEEKAKIIIEEMNKDFDRYSFLIKTGIIDNINVITYYDGILMDIYYDVGKELCQEMDISRINSDGFNSQLNEVIGDEDVYLLCKENSIESRIRINMLTTSYIHLSYKCINSRKQHQDFLFGKIYKP